MSFKQLCIELNISQTTIEQSQANNPLQITGAIFETLRKWRNRRQPREQEVMARELQSAMSAIQDNELREKFTRILIRNRGWSDA